MKIFYLAFYTLVIFGPNVCNSLFQKRRREAFKVLQPQQTVNAIVEIVKENYLASLFYYLI